MPNEYIEEMKVNELLRRLEFFENLMIRKDNQQKTVKSEAMREAAQFLRKFLEKPLKENTTD